MKIAVSNYILGVAEKYSRENSTEYSYRSEFEELLKELFLNIGVKRIDHDAKADKGNKPDFAIVKNQVPILYIETKDIGTSLDKVEKSDQMSRYFGYANLVLTDYLVFRFYRNGVRYGDEIRLAELIKTERQIKANEDKFEYLARTLLEFTQSYKEPIKSGEHLAKIMGGKAQRIRDNVLEFLQTDQDHNETIKVYRTFKKLLVHDLSLETFADMYAQTIVYGLFAARYYDETPDNFTRQEARDLIPNSNPFLRHFFDHIVGPDFDSRLEFIVDELCEVFSHSEVEKLMGDFYRKSSKSKTTHDPVIHFYEDFLKEYDPELRKKMGAYYTPTPVVRFMTKSVDQILKQKFALNGGLTNITKLADGKTHKVQILDPAVGTGTFVSAVIREIYKNFKDQQGRWPKYVHNELLPRIHGFELMMAPYTIAHLKLGMSFKETGFKHFNKRLGIYLTNSLESHKGQQDFLSSFGLAESISKESEQADEIKNVKPIMVIVGNPPYSGESNNKIKEVEERINKKYLYRDGARLNEKGKKNWLQDDYVKFLSLAEDMVEKNGFGIVAMITNNGYLDNPTFRNMRYHLRKTFNEIFIYDLHGNTNKGEHAPDGTVDENVFDIMQGVSIIFALKMEKNGGKMAKIFHAELYGTRLDKFQMLSHEPKWTEISPDDEMQYFKPFNSVGASKLYSNSLAITDVFNVWGNGIITSRDRFIIDFEKAKLISKLNDFVSSDFTDQEVYQKYNLKDNSIWNLHKARESLSKKGLNSSRFIKINYRPFDKRETYFDRNVIMNLRSQVMDHYIKIENNIGLLTTRMTKNSDYSHCFVTDSISEAIYLSPTSGTNTFNFPLYVSLQNTEVVPNFSLKFSQILDSITGTTSPENKFDYIYALLHAPSYRVKFSEFLKRDYPRIIPPLNKAQFTKMALLGEKLRSLHLMKSVHSDSFLSSFPIMGSDIIEQNVQFKGGKVYINDTQYFGKVPESAWNFYIGSYQPAQKWLNDRKGRTLSNEDIVHYQRIIEALTETERIMQEIDATIDL